MNPDDYTHETRFRSIRKYHGRRGTTYTVRWTVVGKDHQRTFATLKSAEAFRAELVVAARNGVPFHIIEGLPKTARVNMGAPTWLEHAMG